MVTNSLDAAIVLSRASRLEVYNIGGTVSPVTRAQEGDWAVHEMERLHVDVSVVCPAGISVERGLTEATPAAAAVSQVEVASGRSGDRAGRRRHASASPLSSSSPLSIRSTLMPSPARPVRPLLQPFVERGITITVAEGPSSD